MELILPIYVKRIMNNLEKAGFSAYLVGGCVRDIIRGKKPNDYDITTDALPQDIKAVFPRSIPTGEKYGTVTVLFGRGKAEVTTFRSESEYTDSRRPERIDFVKSLSGDLMRRDFTVNAMALDMRGNITDLFGGIDDINAGIIRCVGAPEKRFSEDALRMLRAVRFSAQLGFRIDDATASAIRSLSGRANSLSIERVRSELIKTLMSERPETAALFLSLGLIDKLITSRADIDMRALSQVKKDEEARIAAFTALLLNENVIVSAPEFLTRLGCGAKTVKLIENAINASEMGFDTDRDVRMMLRKYGEKTALCAAQVYIAVKGKSPVRRVMRIIRSGVPISPQSLALSGNDLKSLGLSGREIGECIDIMLDIVADDPQKNERKILIEILRSRGYYIKTE